MIAIRTLIPLVFLVLLPTLVQAAPAKPLPVSGSIMSAETNKPLAGIEIYFFRRSENGTVRKPATKTVSGSDGAFTVSLPPAAYRWTVAAAGYGTQENYISVTPRLTDKLAVYLRAAAELGGRIVDGSGKPVAGVNISAGQRTSSVTGKDGRFRLAALDARGYDLALQHPGWVLEKSRYLQVAAGEKKDVGDVVIRRAATLRVTASATKNSVAGTVNKIRMTISGAGFYRDFTSDARGSVTLTEIPPGRCALAISDGRLLSQQQELEISEGEQRDISLKAEVKPPSLNIEDYGDVFLPMKPVKIRAYGLWVEKAEAIISRIDSQALWNGQVDLRKPDEIVAGQLKPIEKMRLTLKARRNEHNRNTRITIPALPPGGYLLELRGGGATARFGFLVTRLGLVAKTSAAGMLLFSTDLVNGAALQSVEIKAFSGKNETSTLPVVSSDATGLARWERAGTSGQLVARQGESLAFLEVGEKEEMTTAASHKGYVYTDRPAYRPGQSVFFKGVLRRRDGEEYRLPQLKQVKVTVNDSGDKNVCEQELSVSPAGSFQGECALPAVPALGGYTISATAGGESWQGWFQVLAYRKPEYDVKLTPDRRFVVAGESGQVRLSARYYFGAPVAGGKVNWRIYTRPAGDAGDEEGEAGEERMSSGYADFIAEGEALLNDAGEALIPVAAKSHEMPTVYSVEADVSDQAARQVSSTTIVTIVPALVSLKLKSASYLAKPGERVGLNVKATTWEGAPLALTAKLFLEREVYDKKLRTATWQQAEAATVATTADGSAQTGFSFPRSGYWRVRGEASDAEGRTSRVYSYLWVWKDGSNWEGAYRELEAEFDRPSYRIGETARLIVRSPATGGTLLLTLEGRDILTRRVLPLNSMVEVVDIPVTGQLAPLVHVSLVSVSGGRFYNRTIPLRVDHQPGKLQLAIKPDKPVYRPGDNVRLKISSAVEGQPLPAELSLAVVDEAILAVTPERADDIYRFFRGTREHLVTTLHSFPRVYLGGASKEAAAFPDDDGLKGLKVRKNFKDTAYWLPQLLSAADGSVNAEFTLPDNLTTWRATVVGHDTASNFGTGREKFIARLDLMARLTPPRFLTVGDELRIPAIVSNMTDAAQQVVGRMESDGLTISGETVFNAAVQARGTLRREMNVKAEKAGSAILRLLVQGTERGTGQGDALEVSLPAQERGIARTTSAGMALRELAEAVEVNLPDNNLSGTADLTVRFAPTIADSLNGAISKLVEFPYGCVEQTLSRFIPVVHARTLLAQQEWRPDAAIAAKLPLAIAEGLSRLEDLQHSDGGWGWWKNDTTRLTMTAHALYGLGLAKRAGLNVPPEMVKRGLQSLEAQIATAALEDLPLAYRALAINGRQNVNLEKRVTDSWQEISTAGRLSYAEALLLAGKMVEARACTDKLQQTVQNEGNAAYIRDQAAESWWYGWRWGSSVVETTASLLSLLSVSEPKNPLTARLAEFLTRRQQGGWWQTTTSSAAAIKALADYVAASGEVAASYTAHLSLNGHSVADYRVQQGKTVSGPLRLSIPATGLKNGNNNLRLSKEGSGVAYLSAVLNYSVPPEAAESTPGLRLERTVYRISSKKDGDRWRREYTKLKAGDLLAPGDDVEVRLTVENPKALEYVIIEDHLPAGFEAREADRDPRFADDSGYRDWYSHRERRDERLAFFITTLPAGRHEFRHVLYPELEGKITALPAVAWPMYQPEVRGESGLWPVEVRRRQGQ